jgi:N-acetylmuramoyl-L-alanine amidase
MRAQPEARATLPPPVLEPAAEKTLVQSIRFWSTEEYTRVIIDMDLDTHYGRGRLSNPDRVFFDISNAKLSPGLTNRIFPVADGILERIRAAQNSEDCVRVVLDLSGSSEYSASEMHNPFRIVVDFPRRRSEGAEKAVPSAQTAEPAKQTAHAAAKVDAAPSKEVTPSPPAITKTEPIMPKEATPAPAPPRESGARQPLDTLGTPSPGPKPAAAAVPKAAPPTSKGDRTLTRVLGLKIGKVVIDPGHGGHDLGSTGRGGLLEKDLVLAIARELKTLLEEDLGAEVVLTRNDDSFVSLEERTAIANRNRADLFISIHANSSRARSTSGVETYYLDFAATQAERDVAARENATSMSNVRDLEDLIKKIAQADKSMESRELASIIQKRLYAGARSLFPSAQNRGVRKAPFVVLIGANMPSALVEVAFISNPGDERLLRKEATQKRLTTALYSGIADYIKTLGVDVVHNQPGAK